MLAYKVLFCSGIWRATTTKKCGAFLRWLCVIARIQGAFLFRHLASSDNEKMWSIFEMALRYSKNKRKSSLWGCFFRGGGYFALFYPKMECFVCWEGVPAAAFGDTPQAGSKRGRPFDFSCSIQCKYGQNVNETLRIYETFLIGRLRREKRKIFGKKR